MENIPKDILFKLAFELDLSDLISLCKSSKQFNVKVCQNENIWRQKLDKDFPDNNQLKDEKFTQLSNRGKYKLLYELTVLKRQLKLKINIYKLYGSETLYMYDDQLKEIPKEIGNLQNLKILYLSDNFLRKIPKEIGNLQKLEELYLINNRMEEIPKDISNLKNLKELHLSGNQLKEIPKEISNLQNLRILNLHNNPLRKIPEEIMNKPNLNIVK